MKHEADTEEDYDLGEDQIDQLDDGVDAFANVGQGLVGNHKTAMLQYWQQSIDDIERISDDSLDTDVFKSTVLPLARIKKVMKTDSEVKMISAEAPILFAKGCDIFITELTMRAWIHAEENKRRTLQRSDIATAIQKSDVFDFLIDIVPREKAQTRRASHRESESCMHQVGHSNELNTQDTHNDLDRFEQRMAHLVNQDGQALNGQSSLRGINPMEMNQQQSRSALPMGISVPPRGLTNGLNNMSNMPPNLQSMSPQTSNGSVHGINGANLDSQTQYQQKVHYDHPMSYDQKYDNNGLHHQFSAKPSLSAPSPVGSKTESARPQEPAQSISSNNSFRSKDDFGVKAEGVSRYDGDVPFTSYSTDSVDISTFGQSF